MCSTLDSAMFNGAPRRAARRPSVACQSAGAAIAPARTCVTQANPATRRTSITTAPRLQASTISGMRGVRSAVQSQSVAASTAPVPPLKHSAATICHSGKAAQSNMPTRQMA